MQSYVEQLHTQQISDFEALKKIATNPFTGISVEGGKETKKSNSPKKVRDSTSEFVNKNYLDSD